MAKNKLSMNKYSLGIIFTAFLFSYHHPATAESSNTALVCAGTYEIYKPEKMTVRIPASAALIDFENKIFGTSIGEFGIQEKDENILWVTANTKTNMRSGEHLTGTIDRLTGNIDIHWIEQSSFTVNRRAEMICKPAKKKI